MDRSLKDSLSGDDSKENENSITSHLRAGSKEIFNLACQDIDEFAPSFGSLPAANSTRASRAFSFSLKPKESIFNKLENKVVEPNIVESRNGTLAIVDNQLALDVNSNINQPQDQLKGKKRYNFVYR